MFLIDQYAYTNKLNYVHPVEKVIFSLVTMSVAITSKAITVHMTTFLMMALITLFIAKIPKRIYFNLLLIPMSFIILGIIPILFVTSKGDIGFIYAIKILDAYTGITKEGFLYSLIIITRSLAAVSCLYFMTLTTALIDIIELLKRIGLPRTLIEIMSLIYRFIFVLIEASMLIYNSQSARLGYSSIGTSFRSLGKLVSMMFIKAYNNSQGLYMSLMSRGYSGELCVVSKEYMLNIRNIVLIVIIEVLMIMLSWMLGGS